MNRLNKFEDSRTAWFLSACLIIGTLLVGNSDLLLGKATPVWDAADFYGPMFSLLADHTKAERLLLWNPWMDGGSPDFADPQAGATSPALLAFGLCSTNSLHGFIAYWIAFWIAGGLGMLLLCRHLRCPAWGGAVASLAFVSSGFYTGHGQHTTILYSFSLLPWVLWRFDVALERRSYWNMVLAGVLWGLSALGGYPALVILDPLFLGIWGLGRVWLGWDKSDRVVAEDVWKRLRFTAVGLVIMTIVGLAVMSPSYVGFLWYARGYTNRAGGISLDYALADPLPPQALGTFASPFLYLLNWPPFSIWPETDISMSSIYTGALVVSLAAIALWKLTRWRLWVAGTMLFFLACSVGKHLPVRGWLYELVPPTRFFRFPSLFSAYVIVALCVLAAYGAREIDLSGRIGDVRQRWQYVLISLFVAALAVVAYRWILSTSHLNFHSVAHASKVLLLTWISPVVLLLLWSRRYISYRVLLAGLVAISLYDATSAIKTGEPTMYSRGSERWWNNMVSHHVASLDLTSNGLERQLYNPSELGSYYQHDRNVALKISTLANDTGMVNPFFQSYVTDPVLNQIALGSQRIWFSSSPVWLPVNGKSFAEYVQTSHKLGVPPLVLHSPDDMLRGSTSSSVQVAKRAVNWEQTARSVLPAPVDLLSYTPTRLSFRYHAPEDGWLLVTDRYARYWEATVNDQAVQVAGANFIFRGIPVARGENVVTFHYEPQGYRAIVLLSWGVIGVATGVEVARRSLGMRLGRNRTVSSKISGSPV